MRLFSDVWGENAALFVRLKSTNTMALTCTVNKHTKLNNYESKCLSALAHTQNESQMLLQMRNQATMMEHVCIPTAKIEQKSNKTTTLYFALPLVRSSSSHPSHDAMGGFAPLCTLQFRYISNTKPPAHIWFSQLQQKTTKIYHLLNTVHYTSLHQCEPQYLSFIFIHFLLFGQVFYDASAKLFKGTKKEGNEIIRKSC